MRLALTFDQYCRAAEPLAVRKLLNSTAMIPRVVGVLILGTGLPGCAGSGDSVSEAGRIQLGVEAISIGTLETMSDGFLGAVSGVEPLQDGRVVVADRLNHSLRLYNANGQLLSETGREGSGPAEFEWLSATSRQGDSLVLALDSELLRLSWFKHCRGPAWPSATTRRFPSQAHDVCSLQGRVFLLGLYEDRAVHEIDGAGTRAELVRRDAESGPGGARTVLAAAQELQRDGQDRVSAGASSDRGTPKHPPDRAHVRFRREPCVGAHSVRIPIHAVS